MELNKIYNMDCIEGMKLIEDNSIDSIVTDPPYELGFMGKSWDNSGIAYNKDVWKEALRVIKPGGHLLAFGGTRTYHRIACAIENAGFEIRDQMQWIYGSGFPKSLNIGKAIDKIQGNEREDLGISKNSRPNQEGKQPLTMSGKFTYSNLTKGTSPYEGWGTNLKPANEPICVARKPLSEKTVAANVLKWGTGGINIDTCRIGTDNILTCGGKKGGVTYGDWANKINEYHQGRFPANVIFDEEAGALLDEQSGVSKSNDSKRTRQTIGSFGMPNDATPEYLDSGGASRFFYCAKASKSERNAGLEGFEEKVGGSMEGGNDKRNGLNKPQLKLTKNIHPTVKPIKLMEYLVKLVTQPGGVVLDPFTGSGTTLIAAKKLGFKYIGIEREEEYCKIAEARVKSAEV